MALGHTLRLYFRLIGAQLRSEMQYRASFLAELIGNFAVTTLDFVALVILLNRFQAIGGWTIEEIVRGIYEGNLLETPPLTL
ncbi:MAG: hypothetical protein AUK03_10640 [Anaerolineae bacterium CG2_30_64_16]|nr:MAG: hypothetical protein AUK03_10640 [Anaerolineae bacterium CG2_30_64_16]